MNRSIRAFLFACLIFLACLTPNQSEADCSCGGGELELVFILDASGSMNLMHKTLTEQIRRIIELLSGQVRDLRIAAVIYRTREYNGKRKKLSVFPFATDSKALCEFIQGEPPEGGGAEIVDDALKAALNELSWTKGARKVAVLLGDEQPGDEMQPRCLELAKVFKERGIVLHAVTASNTAWIYWAPPNKTNWKQQLADMGEEAKRTFRLPQFDELAAMTGGISVSSWNSKELILWLLAFGLGLNEKEAKAKVDPDKFLEWSKQQDIAEAARRSQAEPAEREGHAGFPLIACVRHAGDWQAPHSFERLLAHVGARIALTGPPRVQTLGLLDQQLERYPILYVSGHGAIQWNAAERGALQSHLQRGGFLFADACCGDAAFSASLRELLRELFPNHKLALLPPGHAIYECGHRLEQVRRSAESRSGKLEDAVPELWGLALPITAAGPKEETGKNRERLAVVFSPHDLGCAWHSRPLGVPCMHQDADGLALAANVLLWGLTR